MTQEEKAKAYDEALKQAKFYHGNCPSEPERKKLEKMFPVLHESDDERVRKWLIAQMSSIVNTEAVKELDKDGYEMARKAIIYLEKQKENQYFVGYAKGYSEGQLNPKQKEQKSISQEDFDAAKHEALWGEQKPEHLELKAGHWYICHRAFCCRADVLTVKEGERFMCEKDGVVKGFVIKEPEKYFKECSAPAPMEDEQKEQKPEEWSDYKDKVNVPYCSSEPEWSEEDEKNLKSVVSTLWFALNTPHFPLNYDRIIELETWLKSLRPKPKQEWSDKDEHILNNIYDFVAENTIDINRGPCAKECLDWLKSLRPSWKPSAQELGALKTAVSVLTEERTFPKAAEQIQKIIDVFDGKELRKDWKPSEEQMKWLKDVIETVPMTCRQQIPLESLYNDLLKLT